MEAQCCLGRAAPAEPDLPLKFLFPLSVSDGLLVAPGMIDDADQEGKMFPFQDESHLLLTSDLQSDYLEVQSASSRPTFAPVTSLLCLIYSFKGQQRTPVVFMSVSESFGRFPSCCVIGYRFAHSCNPHAVFQKTH